MDATHHVCLDPLTVWTRLQPRSPTLNVKQLLLEEQKREITFHNRGPAPFQDMVPANSAAHKNRVAQTHRTVAVPLKTREQRSFILLITLTLGGQALCIRG